MIDMKNPITLSAIVRPIVDARRFGAFILTCLALTVALQMTAAPAKAQNYAAKLGPAKNYGDYTIQVPVGFDHVHITMGAAKINAWGMNKTSTWMFIAVAPYSGDTPSVIVTNSQGILEKIAKTSLTFGALDTGNVGTSEFQRYSFSGIEPGSGKCLQGFAYITTDDGRAFLIGYGDVVPQNRTTIPLMDAAVRTIKVKESPTWTPDPTALHGAPVPVSGFGYVFKTPSWLTDKHIERVDSVPVSHWEAQPGGAHGGDNIVITKVPKPNNLLSVDDYAKIVLIGDERVFGQIIHVSSTHGSIGRMPAIKIQFELQAHGRVCDATSYVIVDGNSLVNAVILTPDDLTSKDLPVLEAGFITLHKSSQQASAIDP